MDRPIFRSYVHLPEMSRARASKSLIEWNNLIALCPVSDILCSLEEMVTDEYSIAPRGALRTDAAQFAERYANGKGIRILHTSDLHIGSDYSHGEGSRRAFDALERVVGAAQDAQVDIVLFAGDLLDNNRVPEQQVMRVIDIMRDVDVPLIILPGNHDCYTSDSPYRRFDWTDKLPLVHIFTSAAGELLHFPSLDLAIWGRAHTTYEDFSPLRAIPERGTERWQIAVAHGHFARTDYDLRHSYIIRPEDIEETRRDYIALGHWENNADVSVGGVTAAYSGSPNRTDRVLIVGIDDELSYEQWAI